jgi:hypothetical protein
MFWVFWFSNVLMFLDSFFGISWAALLVAVKRSFDVFEFVSDVVGLFC